MMQQSLGDELIEMERSRQRFLGQKTKKQKKNKYLMANVPRCIQTQKEGQHGWKMMGECNNGRRKDQFMQGLGSYSKTCGFYSVPSTERSHRMVEHKGDRNQLTCQSLLLFKIQIIVVQKWKIKTSSLLTWILVQIFPCPRKHFLLT